MSITELLGKYPKIIIMILMKMPIHRIIVFGVLAVLLVFLFKMESFNIIEIIKLLKQ